MMRAGEGAGITGILMNHTTVDLYNPKTIRSTMGSVYRVPYVVTGDLFASLRELKEAGVTLYAAHLDGTMDYDEASYRGNTAFLIGNEGNGLSDEICRMADVLVRIPMEGQVESLNAAIAATLLAYEAKRQRKG
jgi:TrmH family RNA methyltransferase